MKFGENYRHVGETNMNQRSSRSHTIFRITLESHAVETEASSTESDSCILVSALNLVDLAGIFKFFESIQ